jgi:MFS superfamily sulfate permease-like transporter
VSTEVDEDIRAQIERLLDKPINDENKVLEIIVDAITAHYADPTQVEQAVRQAIYQYEVQMRVFMIANAKAQLRRYMRMMQLADKIEERFEDPRVLAIMEPKDIVALYAKLQGNIKQSLDYIKSVVDMRIEQQVAQAALTAATHEMSKPQTASRIQDLDTQQRDKIRRIFDGLMEGVVNITAPPDDDEDEDDHTPGQVGELCAVGADHGQHDRAGRTAE